jgi:hypothetical protein
MDGYKYNMQKSSGITSEKQKIQKMTQIEEAYPCDWWY